MALLLAVVRLRQGLHLDLKLKAELRPSSRGPPGYPRQRRSCSTNKTDKKFFRSPQGLTCLLGASRCDEKLCYTLYNAEEYDHSKYIFQPTLQMPLDDTNTIF